MINKNISNISLFWSNIFSRALYVGLLYAEKCCSKSFWVFFPPSFLAVCQILAIATSTKFSYTTSHMKQHTSQDLICLGFLFFCVYYSKTHLAVKTPLECVYLLTLGGVHSIMFNQWSSSTRNNAHNLEALMESRSPAHTYHTQT